MIRVIVIGMIIGALWVTSIGVVYWQTRTKWVDLGRSSGEISGLADAMNTLCKFATPGPAQLQADASIVVKANIATLHRHGDLVEIRCE